MDLMRSSNSFVDWLALFNKIYIQWYPQAFEFKSIMFCTGSKLQVHVPFEVSLSSKASVPCCSGGSPKGSI